MTILFAIILGLGLLYFWLCGHWFARIVVFPPMAWAFLEITAILAPARDPPALVALAVVAACIWGAWYVSGLPARRRPILYQPPGAHSWPPPAN